MNKLYTFLAVLLFTLSTQAQSPNKMSYQALIRDENRLVTNQAIRMQISILQGGSFGTVVFSESHLSTTNSNGLLSIQIGTGNVSFGKFSAIDWSQGPNFIKTETDPNGGTHYSITTTSQLLTVPNALHADRSGNEFELPKAPTKGAMNYWDGTTWVAVAPTANKGATIQHIGGVPTWTGGMASLPYSLGDRHAGGIIFWLDPNDNTKGLVCAETDVPLMLNWHDAKDYCKNLTEKGYDDWYLPSLDELNYMYNNLKVAGLGGFKDKFYWSSTNHVYSTSLGQFFKTGEAEHPFSLDIYTLRAVRAF